jgi:hypothetical protein
MPRTEQAQASTGEVNDAVTHSLDPARTDSRRRVRLPVAARAIADPLSDRGVLLGSSLALSAAADQLLQRAREEAVAGRSPLVETAHIVLAAFDGEAVVSRLLRSLIDESSLRAVLIEKGVNVAP